MSADRSHDSGRGPHPARRWRRWWLPLVALGAACASDNIGPESVASVLVTPAAVRLQSGTSMRLTATPQRANGSPLTGRPVVWTSGDTAVAQVSSAGDVSARKVGTATITATSEGVAGRATVIVDPGAAIELAFSVSPGAVTAGVVFAPPVEVVARDGFGNTATDFSAPVTITIVDNPTGGALAGRTTVTAVAGMATFDSLRIDRSGSGFTLGASASGLSDATSAPFAVSPGAATHLAFTVAPGNVTAGGPITPGVEVAALDGLGNVATGFAGTMTIAIGTNPPGNAALHGTTAMTAVDGVATFADLTIDEVGNGYTLLATASGLAGATSEGFAVSPAMATHLVFVAQPTNATAGASISPAIRVSVRDAFENAATGFAGSVTLAIGPGSPGGVLEGTKSVVVVAGVATFGNLNVDEAGSGYTLAATAPGLVGATSSPFAITPGVASQLTFTVEPTDTTAGMVIAPAVRVAARDLFGNIVTSFTGAIAMALGPDAPVGAVLGGTTSVAAAAGVATFGDLSVALAGTGYILTATAPSLTSATSTPFSIGPGAAVQLGFTVQPGNTIADQLITPGIEVTARDVLGNVATGYNGPVAVAIGMNPAGGTLAGTSERNAVAGVASFGDLRIDAASPGYTLTATAGGLAGATSAVFSIIDQSGASQLVFTVQPNTAVAGVAIAPAVQVSARDSVGNTVAGFNGSITVSVATNPGGGALSGTKSVTAVNGVATFADLSVDRSGSGYTLRASASGLPPATSTTFNISPGAAAALQFEVHPSGATAGTDISPSMRVRVVDALGNVVSSPARDVTLALAHDPAEATLAGVLTMATGAPTGPDSGVATFTTVSIDKAAHGYTLEASAAALMPDTSDAFDINPGPAAELSFTTHPATATAGATIAPAVEATAYDALGNTATSFAAAVTVAIDANPGGGTLSGPTTVNAVAGVATFSALHIDKSGSGYTLRAAGGGLATDASVPFTIVPGPASQLAITVQPSETVVDATITPSIEVTARDALGNRASAFGGTVSLTIATNPGAGSLSGTTSREALLGVATFPGLRIDRVGTGYRLGASSAGLSGATSAPFDVVPAAVAVQLAFSVQPVNAPANVTITPAVEVTARDAQGRPATGYTGAITVAIANNPAGGTLLGVKTVAAEKGVATFSQLSIDRVGTGYTLRATATGLATATSSGFAITEPTTVSPSLSTVVAGTDTVGACLAPCVVGAGASRVEVTVRNELGTPLPGVSVSLAATPGDSSVIVNPGPDGVTDAGGVFRADFSSGQTGANSVAAMADGVAILQTATVTVMPVLIGAGDIADCARQADEATAAQLDGMPGQIITLGDNVYPDGTADDFANCYDPSWGRHRDRTRPSAGNRDYNTPGALSYYAYFGSSANPSGGSDNSQGYYSYDVGTWHVIVLNSEILMTVGSPQLQWLRQDLAGRGNQCVLAYWHKPRFASRSATTTVDLLWQTVADSGVDVVLNGHAHLYERFAPMNALGEASPTGARLFVVGTGGASLTTSFADDPPTSEVRNLTSHGVIRVTLYDGGYRWEFLPAPGFGAFADSGTDTCH